MLVTDQMKTRLAFHGSWSAMKTRLNAEMPTRFGPMPSDDQLDFGRAVFDLCHQYELFADDEVHTVSVLMTLFGHRFYTDPRFSTLSDIIFDMAQKARMRRVRPLVQPMLEQVWGVAQTRQTYLQNAVTELNALRRNGALKGQFVSCEQPLPLFEKWQPKPLDQKLFLTNAAAMRANLNVAGPYDLDVCFWTIWVLGLDVNSNPQFRWWIRLLDKAGTDPQNRYQRLLSWLERLASGTATLDTQGASDE